MADDALTRSVRQSIPAVLASLGAWGVEVAHCLPGPDGNPVLWLGVTSDAQRDAIVQQQWLGSQVHLMLLRNEVPPSRIKDVRVMFDSHESIDRMLGEM